MGVSSRWLEAGRARVGASEVPDISNLGAGLAAEDLVANARVTGEVLKAEQSSNNDKGDVKKTFQVLAELKKQQREARPFKGGATTDGCTRAIHGASRDPGD
jgi:hypothetical protein